MTMRVRTLTERVTPQMEENRPAVCLGANAVRNLPYARSALVTGGEERPGVQGSDDCAFDGHRAAVAAEQPDVRAKAPGGDTERQPQQHQHHNQTQNILHPRVE
jgi:hypothetical protein